MLNASGSDPEKTIFIGDSGIDMKTGVNSGMISGGVLWGFRGREELERDGADYLFESPSEIVRTILAEKS